MKNLPNGWVNTTLGEITADCDQRIPAETEEFKYIDIGSINRNTKLIESPQTLLGRNAPSRARKHVKAGDVLVSMTRPNLNAVALVPNQLDGQIASTGFDVLRMVEVDSRWVFHIVKSAEFVEAMSSLVQGALYPAVRSKDIRGFEVPLAPLNEQKRIADKLDAILARVDACRERLDRVPNILKRFRQAALAAATSGRLTEEWREEKGCIGEWSQVILEDVAAGFSYGSSAKSSKAGTVPVLRMGNIQDGRLDWTDLVFTSDVAEISKYALSPGDVLFNRTNSPELVGKTAVYRGERPAVYAGYLIKVRCNEHLLPDYLNYCLNSPAGREYCWSVKSDGVSQSNINAKKLAAFPFSLPAMDEQTEIVRRVEELFAYADRLEARYATAFAQVKRLTPAVLDKAFRGELVPQDPSDEPASSLLERIKSSVAEKSPKVRRMRTTDAAFNPRKLKEASKVTKSRQDEDVKGKPYLASQLATLGGSAEVETLFKKSGLPVADFYKQLAWEMSQGMVRGGVSVPELGMSPLELGDAA